MLLALDLDGTLLTTSKCLTDRNLDAVRRAQDAGTTIVLASGRHPRSMARFADALRLRECGGYLVAFNGALLIDYATGRELFRQHLPASVLPRLNHWARHFGLPMLSFRGDTIITEHPDNHFVMENAANNRLAVEGVTDLAAAMLALDAPPAKCLLPGPPEVMPQVEAELRADLEGVISVYRSAPHYLELVPLGIDKGRTLLRLLSHLGLDQPTASFPLTGAEPGGRLPLMACGDQDNDISMLRVAGLGVAMGNAAPGVKAAADYVTLSCDADGVAHAIERFLLAHG